MSNWDTRYREVNPQAHGYHHVHVRHLPRDGGRGHVVVEFHDKSGSLRTRHSFRTSASEADVRYDSTESYDADGEEHEGGEHEVRALTATVLRVLGQAGFGLRVREE